MLANGSVRLSCSHTPNAGVTHSSAWKLRRWLLTSIPCVLSISSLPRPASTYQNASDSKSWKLVLVPSLLPSALAEYRLLHHLERMKHHRPDISSPELPRLLADLAAAEEAVHAPPTLRCDAEPLFYFPWPYDDELVTLSRRGAPFGGRSRANSHQIGGGV